MSKHIIEVNGCDDSTAIPMDLTDAEFAFLSKFAIAVNAAATYNCKPTITVDPGYQSWDEVSAEYHENVSEKQGREA